jgi:dihydropteroate synthase
LRTRSLELGARTILMGVLNVTPDSFSDGGRYFEAQRAVEHGVRLLDEGAQILDIGGESTRPGARVGESGVSRQEELRRVLPVIRELRKKRPDALISIDTYKAEVARAAVAAGAEIVNDVSAARWDPAMARTMAELQCGVALMHMRGKPEEWRTLPRTSGDELLALVERDLRQWSEAAMAAGVARERIAIDPGFGFGKNFEENYPLLERLGELHKLGFPILAGTSRKSFVGRLMAHDVDGKDAPPEARLAGSLSTMKEAIRKGAHIIRVHDVKESVEAASEVDAIEV